MKRARARRSSIDVYCGACHCLSALDVSDMTEEQIRHERAGFIVCGDCSEKMMSLEQVGALLYFQSHFSDSVVLNSSRQDVVKISRFLNFERSLFVDVELQLATSAAASLIRQAGAILILAGSGMSADSGLSTFRPSESRAATDGRMHLLPLEDACYSSKPEKAWYYDAGYRRSILATVPHLGYSLLQEMLCRLHKPWFVVTTNIDRYFTLTGFPADLVYETHGNIDFLQCSKRGAQRCPGVFMWPSGAAQPVLSDAELSCDLDSVPRCPSCGAMARMNISHLPDEAEDLDGEIKAACRLKAVNWLKTQRRRICSKGKSDCIGGLLILEVGCGGTPHGIQGETDLLLSKHPVFGFHGNASLVRINPESGRYPSYLNQIDAEDFGSANDNADLDNEAKIEPRSKTDCSPDNDDRNSSAAIGGYINVGKNKAVCIRAGALDSLNLISNELWSHEVAK